MSRPRVRKVVELAEQYVVGMDLLRILKVRGSGPNPADSNLPDRVELTPHDAVREHIESDIPALIVGSTVWGIYNAIRDIDDGLRPWFDIILIDEASQLKLPDALVAFSTSNLRSNIILAGDGRQLPPIIHGTYPEEHEHMLSSVFAFMRHRMEQREVQQPGVEERMLFQLETNFRMNEPLTAYPREILYRGRYVSNQPLVSMQTTIPIEYATVDLVDFLLHPDRPAILCHYESPRSYTARNPLEAEIIAQLVIRLGEILVDQETGQLYTPQQLASNGIAILSPHRAQNSTIRNILRQHGFGDGLRPLPIVDTVDKLQGQERDVVLVSYGIADEEYAEVEADFLLSSNRFNVATTHARHKLIVFCSNAILNVVPSDRRILLVSMMLKEFQSYCNDGHRQFPWQTDMDVVGLNVNWKGFGN